MDNPRLTVLVVDDTPAVREFIMDELEAHGIESIGAADGIAGLEAFLANRERIGLVILDLLMPRMSGLDLAAELERCRPGVKILYISGQDGSIAIESIRHQSADRVLLKPFTPGALVERVRSLLAAGDPEENRHVLEAASGETGFGAPDSGAGHDQPLYHSTPPGSPKALLPLPMARLVFSTSGEPLREGVRGAGAATCHLLYEEGNWLLDLHVKPQENNLVSVAGQILERRQSEPAYGGFTVAVLRETVELARTTTNEFGEFQLEISRAENLLLRVALEGRPVLVSALPSMSGLG
jgi:DNA-binding NarL/FixJ family response regulator